MPTTHAEPTYVVDDIVHYCVTNMPGAVPRTSAFALNNVTLPFVKALADKGCEQAIADDPHLANGLNVQAGKITHPAVAKALGVELSIDCPRNSAGPATQNNPWKMYAPQ